MVERVERGGAVVRDDNAIASNGNHRRRCSIDMFTAFKRGIR